MQNKLVCIISFFTFDYVQTPHVRHIPSKLGLCTLLIGVFTFHFSFAFGAGRLPSIFE